MALKSVQKQMLRLLADGNFHSGGELSEYLSLSRTAISNHSKALKALGLPLCSVTGKGYRLAQPLELLDMERIGSGLSKNAEALLSRIEIHDQIDSTNGQLLKAARLGEKSGLVCMAESQAEGKGRLGRKWISPFGCNICLSFLWNYPVGPAGLSGLSLAVGVAVMRALDPKGRLGIGLKWPNDLFWNNQKLGGILVEIVGDALGPCSVVVGIGLNINLPESIGKEIDQPWVSLKKILMVEEVSRNTVTAKLLNELLPILNDFEKMGFPVYLDEWSKWDSLANQKATLQVGSKSFSGIARGINEQGLLLFEDEFGQCKSYASGEVRLRGVREQ